MKVEINNKLAESISTFLKWHNISDRSDKDFHSDGELLEKAFDIIDNINYQLLAKMSLNTNLLPIIDVGTYGTEIGPDCFADDFYGMLDDSDKRSGWNETNFDFDKYTQDIRDIAIDVLKREWIPIAQGFGVIDIINVQIVNPREYNFTNNFLTFDLVVEDNIEETLKTHLKDAFKNQKVRDYINEKWRSFPGWVCLMPKTYEDVIKFDNDEDYAAAFTLLSIHYGYNDDNCVQEQFTTIVKEQLSYEDYATWDLSK